MASIRFWGIPIFSSVCVFITQAPSIRPVDNLQPWYESKVTQVSGNQGCLSGQNNTGNEQIGMIYVAQSLGGAQTIEMMRGRSIRGHNQHTGQEVLGPPQQVIGLPKLSTIGGLQQKLHAPAKYLGYGHDGGSYVVCRMRLEVVDDAGVPFKKQRDVVGVQKVHQS